MAYSKKKINEKTPLEDVINILRRCGLPLGEAYFLLTRKNDDEPISIWVKKGHFYFARDGDILT